MGEGAQGAGSFSPFERWVAWRYLRARRQEGFISVIAGFSFLGIVLGVATLIVTLSVFNGFQTDLLARVLGFQGHVAAYGRTGPFAADAATLGTLSSAPGVLAATPTVEGQALLTTRDWAAGVAVKALSPNDLAARPAIARLFREGSFPQGEDGIALGRRLAERSGIALGGRVTLLSPLAERGEGVARSRSFVVTGLFDTGVSEFDQGIVLMALGTAQSFFELGDRVTGVEIFLADPFAAPTVAAQLRNTVPVDLLVSPWQDLSGAFFSIVETQRNVVTLILAMIVLVASFNIVSGLIMLVQDKAREVAILRTMGASRGAILRIFLLSGASIGILGTLVGAALGVPLAGEIEAIRQLIQGVTGTDLFNADIYFLSELPSRIDPLEVSLVMLTSVALSFLATLYPAWRAAGLDPIEALRYE